MILQPHVPQASSVFLHCAARLSYSHCRVTVEFQREKAKELAKFFKQQKEVMLSEDAPCAPGWRPLSINRTC